MAALSTFPWWSRRDYTSTDTNIGENVASGDTAFKSNSDNECNLNR